MPKQKISSMVFNSGESLDKVSEDGFKSIRDVPRIDDDELISRESPLKSLFELVTLLLQL